MKKFLVLAAAAALIAGGASLALANGSGLGIVNSPHDFTDNLKKGVATPGFEVDGTGGGWNQREEICRVCHVPHDHGKDQYTNGLLWNHDVSEATYTMYDNSWSSTLTHTQDAEPTGNSKLCLACHDGTVGIDTYDKYTTANVNITDYSAGFEVPRFMDGANQDLTGTHPLSIEYDSGDGDVNAPGGLNAVTTSWELSGTIADTLQDGKVQCSTCHDVHDSVGVAVADTHLLRANQKAVGGGTESGLCFTCHNK